MSRQVRRDTERKTAKAAASAATTSARTPRSIRASSKPTHIAPTDTSHSTRVEVRTFLDKNGLADESIRFERAPLYEDPQEDPHIIKQAAGLWIFTATDSNGKLRQRYKVELVGDLWTCGCPAWRKARGVDCKHIKRVQASEGLEEGVLDVERRRPGTLLVFPDGTPSENTRRQNASLEKPTRIPELAAMLCDYVVEEPSRKGARGPIGLPLKATAYAMLMKAMDHRTYAQLRAFLKPDVGFRRLGWLKPKAPCIKTLCDLFGEADLITDFLWKMFAVSARPGRMFKEMLLGDSHDIPCKAAENSRDLKYGPKAPSYRSRPPAVRQHFGVGSITGLIYGADISMNQGRGSGDNLHLPSILKQAVKTMFEDPSKVNDERELAFDKAYGVYRNFRVAEAFGCKLFTLEKLNEDRINGRNWPPSAKEIAQMQRYNKRAFRNRYRFRNKGEGSPSRIKNKTPFMRLRWRLTDKITPYPPEVLACKDDDALSHLPEDVIQALIDVATENVGVARLNEALAILIVMNLDALITLEHLCDDKVDFENDRYLRPFKTVREEDYV